jgi:phage regulator Rha-like protein
MEQARERAKLGDEIEALKKQKEEKEKAIELNQRFLEWLKEKIK